MAMISFIKFMYLLLKVFRDFVRNYSFSDAQYTNAMQLFRDLKLGPDSELKEYNNVNQCMTAQIEEVKGEAVKSKKTKRRLRNDVAPNPSMDISSDWFEECVGVLEEVMSERTSAHFIGPGSEVRCYSFFSIFTRITFWTIKTLCLFDSEHSHFLLPGAVLVRAA